MHEAGKPVRRGRPPSPSRKRAVKLRLDPEVLTSFRATGRGWQTLMNAVLVAAAFRLQKSGARFAFGGLDPSDPDWRMQLHALLRAMMKAPRAKKKAAPRRGARHRPVRSPTQRSANRLRSENNASE
ncbi:MAG TPA: BrnA antitoxin family protein [Methylocella sp.]|nr:BrnA antitoxin family protein [Methylocella sp.]